MNFKEFIEEIALENEIKPGKVRKITKAILEKISQKITIGEIIRTPEIIFKPSKSDSPKRFGLIIKKSSD